MATSGAWGTWGKEVMLHAAILSTPIAAAAGIRLASRFVESQRFFGLTCGVNEPDHSGALDLLSTCSSLGDFPDLPAEAAVCEASEEDEPIEMHSSPVYLRKTETSDGSSTSGEEDDDLLDFCLITPDQALGILGLNPQYSKLYLNGLPFVADAAEGTVLSLDEAANHLHHTSSKSRNLFCGLGSSSRLTSRPGSPHGCSSSPHQEPSSPNTALHPAQPLHLDTAPSAPSSTCGTSFCSTSSVSARSDVSAATSSSGGAEGWSTLAGGQRSSSQCSSGRNSLDVELPGGGQQQRQQHRRSTPGISEPDCGVDSAGAAALACRRQNSEPAESASLALTAQLQAGIRHSDGSAESDVDAVEDEEDHDAFPVPELLDGGCEPLHLSRHLATESLSSLSSEHDSDSSPAGAAVCTPGSRCRVLSSSSFPRSSQHAQRGQQYQSHPFHKSKSYSSNQQQQLQRPWVPAGGSARSQPAWRPMSSSGSAFNPRASADNLVLPSNSSSGHTHRRLSHGGSLHRAPATPSTPLPHSRPLARSRSAATPLSASGPVSTSSCSLHPAPSAPLPASRPGIGRFSLSHSNAPTAPGAALDYNLSLPRSPTAQVRQSAPALPLPDGRTPSSSVPPALRYYLAQARAAGVIMDEADGGGGGDVRSESPLTPQGASGCGSDDSPPRGYVRATVEQLQRQQSVVLCHVTEHPLAKTNRKPRPMCAVGAGASR